MVKDQSIAAINHLRNRIVGALAEYIELSTTMRAFEEMFDVQVLRTGQQLREIVARRRRLEADWHRIRTDLELGRYRSAAELEVDVHAALEFRRVVLPKVHADTSGRRPPAGQPPSGGAPERDGGRRHRVGSGGAL